MDFDGFEEALAECTQAEMQREGNTIDKETKGDLWTILLEIKRWSRHNLTKVVI